MLPYIYLGLGYICAKIPWSFIFLFTQLYGIRLYTISQREESQKIQKRIKWASHTSENGKPYGYSLGYWYFLSITINSFGDSDKYDIWMIATEKSFKMLTENKEEQTVTAPQVKSSITIYERQGCYTGIWFKKRIIKIISMIPRPDQETIMNTIKETYNKSGHATVYIYGDPGTGKSIIGVLLANYYKGSYCNTLRPWQPGDTLANLYTESEPSAECPLIILFDEFDGALIQINKGIPSHKNMPIQIADKTGWNQLLDEIHIGMYPHIILILTSNKSPEFIRDLDPSYIRDGRVDLILELNHHTKIE